MDERKKTQAIDWNKYDGDWSVCEINERVQTKTKAKALTEKEAQIIIADYYQSVRDEVTSLAGF